MRPRWRERAPAMPLCPVTSLAAVSEESTDLHLLIGRGVECEVEGLNDLTLGWGVPTRHRMTLGLPVGWGAECWVEGVVMKRWLTS